MFKSITLHADRIPLNRLIVLLVSLLLTIAAERSLYAQSSPLTVQPSTGRVGVGTTSPGYTLDVNGTINATSLRGDGSQLTNIAGGAPDKVTADATVGNTGTETVLYSFTVPANTLGSNNRLRLVVHGEDRSTACGEDCNNTNYLIRFKYGGTTLLASNVFPWGSISPFKAEFLLNADGATNSQLGLLTYLAKEIHPTVAHGTAAANSTTAQSVQISVQWVAGGVFDNGLGSNNLIRLKHAVLELVK